jgi:translation initiation factor IF-2
MQSTVRVYEIAEDLKMDTDAVLLKIRALGIEVKNKMSKVDGAYLDQIRTSLLREKQAQFVEVEVAPGVKKLKRVEPPPAPAPKVVVAPKPVARVVEAPPTAAAAKEPPRVEAAQAVEPKAVEPRAVEPKAVEPKAVEPKAVEPKVEAPVAPPVAVAPKAEEPPKVEAPAAPPVVVAPKVQEPPKVEAPVAVAPKVEAPVAVAPKVEAPAPAFVVEAKVEAPARVEPESEAPPAPPPAPPPPAAVVVEAKPAEPPRPSTPPPAQAKSGIARWDPVTRTVVYEASRQSASSSMNTNRPAGPRGFIEVKPPLPSGPGIRRPPLGATRPNSPGVFNPKTGRFEPKPFGLRGSASAKPAPMTQMSEHKKVIKIEAQISLQELARRMSLKATDVLLKLIQMGEKGKNINSTLDSDTAKLLASEFGYSVEDVALNLDEIIKTALGTFEPTPPVPRAPVVTVMGHVDHGKTTLLDAILGMRVAEGEAGGITQEVRAYRVSTPKGMVVFFDTPGHEAFTSLRSRGAQLTDVAVLVVAADDGVMPTTVEAINHAKAAKTPIVVALNKMDKPDANPDRVLNQLLQYDVITERDGGDVLVVKVSAKARTGIEDLLENLANQNELLELKADPKRPAVGTVFEAKLDKGRGPVARLLVQEGVLRNGDAVLVGATYGRVRAMYDDRGKLIDKAGPSTPVEIVGLSEVPTAGDKLYVAADLRKAQEVAEQIKMLTKRQPDRAPADDIQTRLENVLRGEAAQININLVVKADAQGAVEGLKKALTSLSTEKVKVSVIHGAVGAITETDVQLASASGGVIIGFNVRPAGKAQAAADEARVPLKFYTIIYEAVDDVRALMLGQLKPTFIEKPLGKAEVRMVFNITKTGVVAGCMVTEGVVKRNARARLRRDGAVKWEGKLGSLRRIKDDVKEVTQGFECGIALENTPEIKPADVIEVYELEEVAARL